LSAMIISVAVHVAPDNVFLINGYAVLATAGTSIDIQAPFGRAGRTLREGRMQSSAIKPFVLAPFRGATPSLEILTARAEFDNGWSRQVSIFRGVAFLERVRTVKHPDIAMGIRRRSTDTTQQH